MSDASVSADLTDVTEKLSFASPQWVNLFRTVLEELVAKHGEAGKSFSRCCSFTDAPPGVAGADSTTVAWHFRIVDKTVTVGTGEVTDVDMNVSDDYESALPMVRLVYTPEMVAQAQESNPAPAEGESGGAQLDIETRAGLRDPLGGPPIPTYVVELHNRMAVVTR